MPEAYVYILTNKTNYVLYTGSTTNLIQRVHQHKHKLLPGFTEKYNINKLVYYEIHDGILNAGFREKQIKNGSRKKKIQLIETINPNWEDLYENLIT